MNLSEIDFGNLEWENIGNWPPVLKKILLLLVFVAILALGYFQYIADLFTNYSAQKDKIEALKSQFEDAHNKVSNLNAYKEQMKTIQTIFDSLKKQLPKRSSNTSDDAALLEEISQQSDISGLKFRYMKPENSQEKGFYIEYPIELSVSGPFNGLGEFVSNISNMPRIVTLHDFEITSQQGAAPAAGTPGASQAAVKPDLLMNVKAKTYWATNSAE